MDSSVIEEITACIIGYRLPVEMTRAPRPVDDQVLAARVEGGASA